VDLLEIGGLDALEVSLRNQNAAVAKYPPQVLKIASMSQVRHRK